MRWLLFCGVLATGCDPQVRPGATPAGSAAAGGPRAGVAGESCARVADCAEPLRCVDAVCAPAETSTVAEYYWAAAPLATGERRAALYRRAAEQFDADKVARPAAFLCEHGRFLLGEPGAQSGEQAARLLHRCVLGSPPGSRQRREALSALARLQDRGLEPSLLARPAPADSYLVNPATAPRPEALAVEVERTVPARDKGYAAFAEALAGPKALPALARCFAEEWERSHRPQLTVALPLKLRAELDDNDEYAGGTLEIGGEGAAAGCLRAGLAPLAAEQARSGSSRSWQGTVTVTVKTK